MKILITRQQRLVKKNCKLKWIFKTNKVAQNLNYDLLLNFNLV